MRAIVIVQIGKVIMTHGAFLGHHCGSIVKLFRGLVDFLHVPYKWSVLHKLFLAFTTFDRLLLVLSVSMRERVNVERINSFKLERAEPTRYRPGSLVDHIVFLFRALLGDGFETEGALLVSGPHTVSVSFGDFLIAVDCAQMVIVVQLREKVLPTLFTSILFVVS